MSLLRHAKLFILIVTLVLVGLQSVETKLSLTEEKKYLYLVAHHKSGTRISKGHYTILCGGLRNPEDNHKELRTQPDYQCPRILLSTKGIETYKDVNETLFVHYIRHPIDMLLVRVLEVCIHTPILNAYIF